MIAGCQHRFVPKIESGFKRHTIRAGCRWRAGMRIDLFTDVRQKNMKLIFRAPVTKVEPIVIHMHPAHGIRCVINGSSLMRDELRVFAQRDGFDTVRDMHRFWMTEHYKAKLADAGGWMVWQGQIIHWDYERRTRDAVGRRLRTRPKDSAGKRRKPGSTRRARP